MLTSPLRAYRTSESMCVASHSDKPRRAARRVRLSPGETSYSPISKQTILTWKASATPTLITSDTEINKLEKKGKLSERATSIRLNCPIIEVGKGA